MWKDWKRDGDFVSVQVRAGFDSADLDDKAGFDAILRCAISDGRTQQQGISAVEYVDARTGKPIAHWFQATGFSMQD